MAYDLYPAVDEQYNFPPEVRRALSLSLELRNGVVPLTTTQRNNLGPTELWDGRVIANITTNHVEQYDADTSQWFEIANMADLNSAVAGLAQRTPPGIYLSYAGAIAPPGWLLCDGQAVSRLTYAALFAVCQVTYGIGDGSTTFNLPDLRGRSPIGYDASESRFNILGMIGGAITHFHNLGTAYALIMTRASSPSLLRTGKGGVAGWTANESSAVPPATVASVPSITNATALGGTTNTSEGLSPYIVTNYIIKT